MSAPDSIRGQIYNQDGSPSDQEFQINNTDSSTMGSPVITTLSDGRFVVAWSTLTPQGYDISLRIFEEDGKPATGDITGNAILKGEQFMPKITALAHGNFAVAFIDNGVTGTHDIRVQIFNDRGNPVGEDFVAHDVTSGTQTWPDMVTLPDGGFVMCWESNNVITVRAFSGGGSPGPEIQIPHKADFNINPDITVLSDGRYFVVWSTGTSGRGTDTIMGQVVNPDGSLSGETFIVNGDTEGAVTGRGEPVVTTMTGGRVAVSWTVTFAEGSSFTNEVYGTILSFQDDQNRSPTNIRLNGVTVLAVDENTPFVGTLSAEDADGDKITYSLSGDGPANRMFLIEGNQLKLAPGQVLDFEALPEGQKFYQLSVIASDGRGGSTQQVVTINVNDLEPESAAPYDITLSRADVRENAAEGTFIGTLKASDPNPGDEFRYELLDDAGGRFVIVDGQIVVADGVRLDFEAAQHHTIRVRATDSTGLSFTKLLTISVKDVATEFAVGSSGNDVIHGGRGQDTLFGMEGHDKLHGGLGHTGVMATRGEMSSYSTRSRTRARMSTASSTSTYATTAFTWTTWSSPSWVRARRRNR